MAKEEIQIGPFREVSLDPKFNLVSNLKYEKKNGLRYYYALEAKAPRGTFHYGEHSFHGEEKGIVKDDGLVKSIFSPTY